MCLINDLTQTQYQTNPNSGPRRRGWGGPGPLAASVSTSTTSTAAASSSTTIAGATAAQRAAALREIQAELGKRGLDAFLVPSGDPHLSEYPAVHFWRRAFVSGFDGSAGTAVVTSSKALLWTDGRYHLQGMYVGCGGGVFKCVRVFLGVVSDYLPIFTCPPTYTRTWDARSRAAVGAGLGADAGGAEGWCVE